MSTSITEDEAALYDRQLRLWGVEAQNRMRNSSVLVYSFRGVAAEITKNIVLAGVGNVTLLDERDVEEMDLGANYFLREEEVGKKRVEAGAPRVQALNPRVNLTTRTDAALLADETFLATFDLIVLTDVDAPTLLRTNALTRKLGKKLYAASSLGMDGWIFADLLDHEFISDDIKTGNDKEQIKVPKKSTNSYAPFDVALQHQWTGMKARELNRTPDSLWGLLSLWAAQQTTPDVPISPETLASTATTFLPTISVTASLLTPSTISRIAQTSSLEFPPSCAIIGGVAGQDVLNILGGKEEPVRNLMLFDGTTGAGAVWAVGV